MLPSLLSSYELFNLKAALKRFETNTTYSISESGNL